MLSRLLAVLVFLPLGVILAIMSVVTLISAFLASRRAAEPELATAPETATANA